MNQTIEPEAKPLSPEEVEDPAKAVFDSFMATMERVSGGEFSPNERAIALLAFRTAWNIRGAHQ